MNYLPLFAHQGRIYSLYEDVGFGTFEEALSNLHEWMARGLKPYAVVGIRNKDISGGIRGHLHLSTGEVITIISYTGFEVEQWISRN